MENKIEEFKKYLMNLERSASTIESYVLAVRFFFERYEELSKENMIDFKQWLMGEYKPKTAALRCVAMNVFCDYAGRPDCKVKGIKVYFIVKFLAGTGCRASELAKLEKSCLSNGEFTLWTKGKIRTIMIPKHLIEESREYFKTVDSNYLFPNRFGEQITTRGIGCLIKKYGLKYKIREEVLHPHAFRHLFAILFLKENKNIALLSDILGHESLNTTAIYLRLSAAEQKKQLDRTVKW